MSVLPRMKNYQTTAFYRRGLPHWHVVGHSYFVTFRLKNSIPVNVFKEFKLEYETALNNAESNSELTDIERKHFLKIERILDGCKYSNLELDCEVSDMIGKSIVWLEENYLWRIPSYVIMPNHVHCLMVGSEAKVTLAQALKMLKGWTARKANILLNRTGSFWAPESFERWCRSAEEEDKVKRYIQNNPVKAGLVKSSSAWKWIR
jgi:putative transposase